jgi:hypothetical protein
MGVLVITNDLNEEAILFSCGWVATPVKGEVVDLAG